MQSKSNLPKSKNNKLTKYQEISNLFKIAEKGLKRIERLNGVGLYFPTVNELRYVAFHILESLFASEQNDIEGNLYEAREHCIRAIYDAMAVGISHLLERIKCFENDYRKINISSIIPDYIEKKKRVREIQKLLAERERKEYVNDYQAVLDEFEELYDIYILFDTARDELNKKVNKLWWSVISTIIFIIIGILGIILAL